MLKWCHQRVAMELKLKNIGIIKEADIKINGLTVIAGENDSGKSTVGKVLYSVIKTISQSKITLTSNLEYLNWQQYRNRFNQYVHSVFNEQLSKGGTIEFDYGDAIFNIEIEYDNCTKFTIPENYEYDELGEFRPIVIETPFIWSILPTLNTADSLKARNRELEFELSPMIDDLHYALTRKLRSKSNDIKLNIEAIINGNFTQENGNFIFKKEHKNIALTNVAMGIKYFGILQVLSSSNYLYKEQILILDEPEVHLHPKWQLELANIIVFLVKSGVKILVNSHSPYMIEALERYSKIEDVPVDFYLAQNANIQKIEDSNSRTLSAIFEKLSEPFDTFEKMESDRLQNS